MAHTYRGIPEPRHADKRPDGDRTPMARARSIEYRNARTLKRQGLTGGIR